MKQRKLFQAKDSEGNLHYIENLEKNTAKEIDFFCPHCNASVVPKMGTKKTWHFAHVDTECDKIESKEPIDSTKDIWSFTKKFTVGSDFKIDPGSYQCFFCKNIQGKKYGVQWSESIYLCKECYRQLDNDKIERLQWESVK